MELQNFLHKTDDFFLFQKKRIYRPWSAEETATINTYFQHYIEDTTGDLTKKEAPFQVGIPFTLTIQDGLDPTTVTQSAVSEGE